jgi:ABC-type glucose/galactose transport system permease subunit
VLCGVIFGMINGIGVAYLRVPSMIFTLGINAVAQGFMVVRTGGAAPQDMAPDNMHDLATGRFLFGVVPNPVLVWLAVGILTVLMLRKTIFGRAIYAIGNREIAAYLSGISTQRVVVAVFAISGGLSAFAGTLLAGYSTKAYQNMGDPYLLPPSPRWCWAAPRSWAGGAPISAPWPGSSSSPSSSRSCRSSGYRASRSPRRIARWSMESSSSPCCCSTAAAPKSQHKAGNSAA